MPVFKSGAFLQQCFSVHPLSLCLKLVAMPATVGVLCVNCRMRHRMTVKESPTSVSPESKGMNKEGLAGLNQCFQDHPEDIRMTSVAVEHDTVQFRCRPCHRLFSLGVRLFETHQS